MLIIIEREIPGSRQADDILKARKFIAGLMEACRPEAQAE